MKKIARYKSSMNQMKNEAVYNTDEKSLLEEIIITIGEYFDCDIVQTGGIALLNLKNGQRFALTVKEA